MKSRFRSEAAEDICQVRAIDRKIRRLYLCRDALCAYSCVGTIIAFAEPVKIFNAFFIVVFILFAALQYNDPDPYIWMPVYLYAAWCCYLGFRGIYAPVRFYVGLFVFIIYAIFLFFSDDGVQYWLTDRHAESLTETMNAEKPWIEQSREFFGLLIVCGAISINAVYLRRRQKG
jgi:hypothetical protein